MTGLDRWWDWLAEVRATLGTREKPATNLMIAIALDVHENTVLAWTKNSVPSVDQETKLAALMPTELKTLQRILDEARGDLLRRKLMEERLRFARQERLTARPQPGTAKLPAVPSQKPSVGSRRSRGRRKVVGAILLGVSTAWGSAAAEPRPVDLGTELTPSYRTRRRRIPSLVGQGLSPDEAIAA